LGQLEEYMKDVSSDLRVDPLAQVRVVIGRLLKGGLNLDRIEEGAMVPALAGVRGGIENPRIYQAEDVQIAIEVHEDGEHIGRFAMTGLVSKMEWAGSQVYLSDSEELIAETIVEEAGEFVFEDLTSGKYSLVIKSPSTEIHLDIEVG